MKDGKLKVSQENMTSKMTWQTQKDRQAWKAGIQNMLIGKEKGHKIEHTPRKYATQDKEEETE